MSIGSVKLCLGSQGGNKFNSKYDLKNSTGQMLIMYTRVDFNIELWKKVIKTMYVQPSTTPNLCPFLIKDRKRRLCASESRTYSEEKK
jgi:hypothetical protein